MYGSIKKLGTLPTAQMMCEKEYPPSSDGDCMSRMMTPEDWEKYGPSSIRNIGETQKSNVV